MKAEMPDIASDMWTSAAKKTPATLHNPRRNPWVTEDEMQFSALGPSGMLAATQIAMNASQPSNVISAPRLIHYAMVPSGIKIIALVPRPVIEDRPWRRGGALFASPLGRGPAPHPGRAFHLHLHGAEELHHLG